jgi:hypothetical protein
MAEQDILVADDEIPLGIAHGRGTVTAAARLVKQHRAMLIPQGRNQIERRRGCRHAWNAIVIHPDRSLIMIRAGY